MKTLPYAANILHDDDTPQTLVDVIINLQSDGVAVLRYMQHGGQRRPFPLECMIVGVYTVLGTLRVLGETLAGDNRSWLQERSVA